MALKLTHASNQVYPTVAALAGLPPPPDLAGRPANEVGTSLMPVFLDPAAKPGAVKDFAFSEFPQCPGHHPVPGAPHSHWNS